MTRAILLASLAALTLSTHVFVAIDHVRAIVVKAPIPATAGMVRTTTAGFIKASELRPPFALIARINVPAPGTTGFSIAVDGAPVCERTVSGGSARRIDCAVAVPWDATAEHAVVIQGPPTGWTLEYLELATQHGNTGGAHYLVVLPASSDRYVRPELTWTIATWLLLLAAGLLLPAPPRMPRWVQVPYGVAVGLVALEWAVGQTSQWISDYRIVLSAGTFAMLLVVLFVPRLWAAGRNCWAWSRASGPDWLRRHLPSSWSERGLGAVALFVVGGLGYAARVAFAFRASGTNDIVTWERFATQIADHGLLYQYAHDPTFNHPPLMGWLARGTLALAHATGLRFAFLFKLPAIAADLGSGLVLLHAWSRRVGPRQGALAFALYGWSAISFLVSAHHGNTDAICAMLVLAAVVLSECHGAYFAAGVALGAAINVKLIPIFCVPALLASGPRSRRDVARCLMGLSLGVVPFVPVLLTVGAAFYQNAIAYNSNPENWGIPYLLRTMTLQARFELWIAPWVMAYPEIGRKLILLSVSLAALAFGRSRRLDGWWLTALSLALFLVLAPGFGVQYLVYAAPVLFAVSPWRGFRYACIAGFFAGVVYLAAWDGSVPYYTEFVGWFPAATVPFGILTWAWLVAFVREAIARGVVVRPR